MKEKKQQYFCIAPDGTKITRSSAHVYTHAVICFRIEENRWGDWSMHSNRQLAEKSLKAANVSSKYFSNHMIVEVQKEA